MRLWMTARSLPFFDSYGVRSGAFCKLSGSDD
jgi:hypothetical protein